MWFHRAPLAVARLLSVTWLLQTASASSGRVLSIRYAQTPRKQQRCEEGRHTELILALCDAGTYQLRL